MSQITWLHISDLHLKVRDDYNSLVVREAFLQDLQNFCLKNNLPIDLIFMTGDIAFSGQPEEYKIASQFFDQLLALTKTPKDHLFIIPGNHDVNRRDITPFVAKASLLLNNRDDVNSLLLGPDCSYICQRLHNYVQFFKEYFGDNTISTVMKLDPHYYAHLLNLSGKTIAVLGLNSAWLCTGDNDRHNLVVGERQVRDTIKKSKEASVDWVIALLHHPLDWLMDFDASDTQTLLMQGCNFMLRGHLHKTDIELISSPDAKVLHIAAGALYETRVSPNAYNIVSFDPENGDGTIYLRRYSDNAGGFFAPDTLTYRNAPEGQYYFSFPRSIHAPSIQTSADALLSNVSSHLLHQSGNKRTAYPTDMNFRELFEKQVYIPPRFLFAYETNPTSFALDRLLDQIDLGSNILILGDPGAGKSFFTFIIQQHIAQQRSDPQAKICLPVDLRIFIEEAVKQDISLDLQAILHILSDNYTSGELQLSQDIKLNRSVFFIVDGIDEVSGNPLHVNAMAQLLNELGKLGHVMVTCRTRDFEYVFAPYIDSSFFDSVLKVKEWDLDTEFAEFVKKLENAGLFADNGFVQKIKSSATLRTLVRLPLHARMLTFVSQNDLIEVSDVSQLYGDYLRRYSVVVDTRLRKENCLQKPETYLLWRELAWYAFQKNLFIHDKIPLKALNDFLINMLDIHPTCISRLLHPLFNFVQISHSDQIQFVHYSFFEYFVADFMANALIGNYLSGTVEIYPYFTKDMTPEIRHQLTRILNRTKHAGFAKWLTKGYTAINETAPDRSHRQVANNLLVYILGRLNEDIGDEIQLLLKSETDDFLRTSLYWGLCALLGTNIFREYMEILDISLHMRNLNRGYLLYYYNDLDRSKDPPYLDDNPKRGWANTKLRTLQFMAASDYQVTIGIGRRLIDLYTFYDFCIFRNEALSGTEISILAKFLDILGQELNDKVIIRRLRKMHQKVIARSNSSLKEKEGTPTTRT